MEFKDSFLGDPPRHCLHIYRNDVKYTRNIDIHTRSNIATLICGLSNVYHMVVLEVIISLSLVGSSMMLFSPLYFPQTFESPVTALLFCMAVSNCISCVPFLSGDPHSPFLCSILGVLNSFGHLAGTLWTAAVASCMYNIIVLRFSLVEQNEKFWTTFVIINVVSLFVSCLPLINNDYNLIDGEWCWIVGDDYSILWLLLCRFIPVGVAIGYSSYVYYVVGHKLKNMSSNLVDCKAQSSLNELALRMKWYPMILTICYFGCFLHRMTLLTNGKNSPAWMDDLDEISLNLVGLLDCVAYGYYHADLWFAEFRKVFAKQNNNGISSTCEKDSVANPMGSGSRPNSNRMGSGSRPNSNRMGSGSRPNSNRISMEGIEIQEIDYERNDLHHMMESAIHMGEDERESDFYYK